MCMTHCGELELKLELEVLMLTGCAVGAITVEQQGLCQLDVTALADVEVVAY